MGEQKTDGIPSGLPDEFHDVMRGFADRFQPRVIFDVGAFRGAVTSKLMQLFPHASYELFEPQTDWCQKLKASFASHANVTVNGVALLDREGETDFHLGSFAPTSSIFPRNIGGKVYYAKEHGMLAVDRVPSCSLDGYCASRGIAEIDVLKIDTQGSEHAILRGGKTLLREQRIHVVLTEFFAVPHYEGAPLFDEIWGLMRSFDYNVYRIFLGPHAPDGQLRYGDAIFLSNPFRERFL